MATAIPGIIIKSIHGKIGNVVFYYSRGKQCIRTYVIPRNPDTEAQRLVRRAFGDAVRSWQAMRPDDKYAYNKTARFLNMSGYNLFISNYLKRIIQTIDHSPVDEQKSKVHSLPWNLELPTLNLLSVPELVEGFPSVSEPYTRASRINSGYIVLKHDPG